VNLDLIGLCPSTQFKDCFKAYIIMAKTKKPPLTKENRAPVFDIMTRTKKIALSKQHGASVFVEDFDIMDELFWAGTANEEFSTPLGSQLTVEGNVFDDDEDIDCTVVFERPLESQLHFAKGQLFDEESISLITNTVQSNRKNDFQMRCSLQIVGGPKYCPPDLSFELRDLITDAQMQELVDLFTIDEARCKILYTTLLGEQLLLVDETWIAMSHEQRYQEAIEKQRAINEGKILPPWDYSVQVIANMANITVKQLLQSDEVINNYFMAVARACIIAQNNMCAGNTLKMEERISFQCYCTKFN
jgi:hypothetical protein